MNDDTRNEFLNMLISFEERGLSLSNRRLAMLLYLSLQANGTSDFGDMADALRISRPATTRGTQVLQEEGLISTKTDKHDRRKVIVNITAKGRSALDREPRRVRMSGDIMASA